MKWLLITILTHPTCWIIPSIQVRVPFFAFICIHMAVCSSTQLWFRAFLHVFFVDLRERLRFVGAYMESSGTTPNSSKVEELVKEIERYTLASHLHWGLWGIISVSFFRRSVHLYIIVTSKNYQTNSLVHFY